MWCHWKLNQNASTGIVIIKSFDSLNDKCKSTPPPSQTYVLDAILMSINCKLMWSFHILRQHYFIFFCCHKFTCATKSTAAVTVKHLTSLLLKTKTVAILCSE